MKLLILTQKMDVNDPILGFFVRWVEEFAKHCENVIVICLEKGEYDLPSNVKVLSLGKEEGGPYYIKTLRYIVRFYKYIWSERRNYDSVFVHMNQIYVILGGLFWRMLGKRISLWYTHKSVTFSLRIAEKFVHTILTASEKSFRLKSKKKIVTGHGIDIELFKPDSSIEKENIVLTVGRISEAKNNIKMLTVLKNNPALKLVVVGSSVTEKDKVYKERFLKEIKDKHLEDRIELIENVPQSALPEYYNRARVFINLSDTGSLDKVVLEALAMNVPVYTTNEAF
ncbi:MAG TPA: glycosyltransferase, partial [Candidatus Kaiserbacteria bacterium]|nr:glycosyltransferase [Candidatus Kaiserbacteria bacterium]